MEEPYEVPSPSSQLYVIVAQPKQSQAQLNIRLTNKWKPYGPNLSLLLPNKHSYPRNIPKLFIETVQALTPNLFPTFNKPIGGIFVNKIQKSLTIPHLYIYIYIYIYISHEVSMKTDLFLVIVERNKF